LRPLYPLLPVGWVSRALRVSMPEAYWRQFEAWLARMRSAATTDARAAGLVLMGLMDAAERGRGQHWLDWEQEKSLRLLPEIREAA
jgi:hypothetical protein